jgi:hypothetical protein
MNFSIRVDGDPTKEIADLRGAALVITQGKLIAPQALLTAMGINPFVTETPALRAVGAVGAAGN